jgi:hypothetical protein
MNADVNLGEAVQGSSSWVAHASGAGSHTVAAARPPCSFTSTVGGPRSGSSTTSPWCTSKAGKAGATASWKFQGPASGGRESDHVSSRPTWPLTRFTVPAAPPPPLSLAKKFAN